MSDPYSTADAIIVKYKLSDIPNRPQLRKELIDIVRKARAGGVKDILEFCRSNPNAYCSEVIGQFGKRVRQ